MSFSSEVTLQPERKVLVPMSPELALKFIRSNAKTGGNVPIEVHLMHFMAANCPDVIGLVIERLITPLEQLAKVGDYVSGCRVIKYDPYAFEPYSVEKKDFTGYWNQERMQQEVSADLTEEDVHSEDEAVRAY